MVIAKELLLYLRYQNAIYVFVQSALAAAQINGNMLRPAAWMDRIRQTESSMQGIDCTGAVIYLNRVPSLLALCNFKFISFQRFWKVKLRSPVGATAKAVDLLIIRL